MRKTSPEPLSYISNELSKLASELGLKESEFTAYCMPSYSIPTERCEGTDIDVCFAVPNAVLQDRAKSVQISGRTKRIAKETVKRYGWIPKVVPWINPLENFQSAKEYVLPPIEYDETNVRDGIDGLANRAVLFRNVCGGLHMAGQDVITRLRSDKAFETIPPVEGYEMYVVAVRDLAVAVLKNPDPDGDPSVNSLQLAKAMLRASYAMHLLANRGPLVTYGEIADASERTFNPAHKKYEGLVRRAADMRMGKADNGRFDLSSTKEVETIVGLFNFARARVRAEATRLRYFTDPDRMERLTKFYCKNVPWIAGDATKSNAPVEFVYFFVQELIDYLAANRRPQVALCNNYKIKMPRREDVEALLRVIVKPPIAAVRQEVSRDIEATHELGAHTSIGRAWLELGDHTRAMEHLTTAIQGFESIDKSRQMGQIGNDVTDAYYAYNRLDLDMVLADLYASRGEARWELGTQNGARTDLDRSLKLEPLNGMHTLLRAELSESATSKAAYMMLYRTIEAALDREAALYGRLYLSAGPETPDYASARDLFEARLKGWMGRKLDEDIARWTAEASKGGKFDLEWSENYRSAFEHTTDSKKRILDSLVRDAKGVREVISKSPSPSYYPRFLAFYRKSREREEEVAKRGVLCRQISTANSDDIQRISDHLSKARDDPERLREVIAIAREQGFTEIASDLEKRIQKNGRRKGEVEDG